MKSRRISVLLSLLVAAGFPAFGTQAPEDIYNLDEIEALTVGVGGSSKVTFRRLDGLEPKCPVTLAIEVEGEVEANGFTDGYYDEVSVETPASAEKAFAGDTGPAFDSNGDPLPFVGVTKIGRVEVEVKVGEDIVLRYETRNGLWNEGWGAKITSVEIVDEGCADGTCSFGGGGSSSGAPNVSINLGSGPGDLTSAGSLSVYYEDPTTDLSSPASLRLASGSYQTTEAQRSLDLGQVPDMLVMNDAGNAWKSGEVMRQIATPNAFIDIVTNTGNDGYEVRFYQRSALGSRDANGLFTLAGGSTPEKVWRVEVTAGATPSDPPESVRFIEQKGGNSRTTEFTWEAVDSDWSMTRGTGDAAIRERRITTVNGASTTETLFIYGMRDGSEVLMHEESETRTSFPFGTVITETTRGSGANQLVTTYEYWPVGSGSNRDGKLKRRTDAEGGWEYFHAYDANGRATQVVRQYLGNAYSGTWPDNANRMVETTYADSGVGADETFATSQGAFTTYDVAGNGRLWLWKSTDGGLMEANGFGAGTASDTWLISPAYNLGASASPFVSFESYFSFTGPDPKLMVSTNYTGGDPSAPGVSWTEVSASGLFAGTSGVWEDSGRIDLSAWSSQTVHIAFQYLSNGGGSGDAKRWRVRNFRTGFNAHSLTERKGWLAGNLIERSWTEVNRPFDDRTAPGTTLGDTVRRTITATDVTISDPDDASHRVTTRSYYPKDAAAPGLPNRLRKVEFPDGEIELHEYTVTAGDGVIHKRWRGLPNAGGDAVTHGTLSEQEENSFGQVIRSEEYYLAPGESPLLTEMWLATQVGDDGRPTEITYGDRSVITRVYSCCGLKSETTRDGLTLVYSHDSLGRVTRTETWNGTTMLSAVDETLDALGRVIARTLEGRDGGTIDTYEAAYLTNGDLDWERDALGRLIEHDTLRQSGGHTVRTSTLPDSALIARETRTWPDGRLHRETGLAVNDTETTYAFEPDPDTTGNTLEARTTTFLDASGTPTGEFRTLASRPSGLLRLEHRPAADGSGTVTARTVLDTAGRTLDSEDVHGVITRFEYPDPFTTIRYLDADQDGSLGAADTATRNRRIWASAHGTTVQRQSVEEWNEAGTWELVSQSDRETLDVDADGMEAWQLTYGAETYTLESPLSGSLRTVTTTFPDGTGSVSQLDGGRLDWTRRLDDAGSHLRTVTRSYDEFGRVGSVIDSIDGTTTWLYDDLGRITSETLPDPDPSDPADGPETRTTGYTLLTNGNEQQVVTHPGSVTTTTVFDPQGRTVLRYGFGTWPEAWTYDPAGRQATLTTWQDFDTASGTGLAGETVTRWEYNNAGLLEQKHYNDTPTASEPGPLHAYTPGGLLLTRTLPRNGSDGQPIVVSYDYEDGETGEPHTARLIDVSYGANTPNTDDVTYTWDNRGRLETVEDGSGRRRLSYEAGQVVSDLYETGPLAGFGHSLTLDSANGYRPSGRSILSPTGTLRNESLAYDAFGRMDALTVDDDTVAYGFHHDSTFPTTTTVSRDGTASVNQTRVYDRRGRLDSINATDGTTTLFSAAQTFDTHGRVTRITLDGGAYWDYGYDSMGQVTSGVKKDSGGTALPGYSFGYGFDTIGNRETATRESTTETYTPNLLNQISTIDHAGLLHLLGTADASATVLVDGAATTRSGNLFYGSVSGNNSFETFSILGTLTGAGDGGRHAVARFDREAYIPAGATDRTHDESGNLTEDAEWLYTWDAENRLVQMETRPSVVTAGASHRRLTFEYDSQSRRTRKTVELWDGSAWQTNEDIRFLWNDWLLSAELEADTLEPIRSYTWGLDLAGTRDQTGGVGGLALVKHHKNSEVSVPLYTTNGNVRGYWEIDTDALVAEFEYGPFGELLKATGGKAEKHPFRWSTKYEDTQTGLVYYGYRFFDPELGRWLNRDKIGEKGGINSYGFIKNQPLHSIDLFGLLKLVIPNDIDISEIDDPLKDPVDGASGRTHFNNLKLRIEVCPKEADTVSDLIYSSLKTFEHFNQGNSSNIELIGDVAIFWPNSSLQQRGLIAVGHDIVSVHLSYEDNARRVIAITTGEHFLNGRRVWGVNKTDSKKAELMIYTAARERYSSVGFRGVNAVAGFIDAIPFIDLPAFRSFESEVQSVWSTYLNNIADDLIEKEDAIQKYNEEWTYFTN